MITEADTCRKYVLPKLIQSGWDNDPHSFTEQKTFTDGRIVPVGEKVRRRPQKRADYLLRYTRDFLIGVLEAKAAYKSPADGLQQAKDYAEVLGLKFAYSTNGHGIVEFDSLTGRKRNLETFPTPQELWSRFRAWEQLQDDTTSERLLTPYSHLSGKSPRYYQEIAINRIIVDECHRGSAKDDSAWREILDYFEPAYQLGMTATPLREDTRDTYAYFGNPLYTYSLRQGIEDGFLAPYRVHRVVSTWDAAGWRPSKDDLDRYGRPIPDDEYHTKDFERVVALRARTQAIARHLTEFLKKTDRYAKTIVFCVDQEHAADMRQALTNLNADIAQQSGDYVCRVTAEEGDIGRGLLGRFQELETTTPVILTTSQLLTTGVDAPTCKNIVLARVVNSMTEFKQMIGRGTRVRDDYGKLYFNILDYTGSATRLFADPDFDGDPVLITQEEMSETGEPKAYRIVDEQPVIAETQDRFQISDSQISDDSEGERRKYYFDGGQVEIVAHIVHELDPDGKQLRVVKFTDYAAEKVRTLYRNASDLRAQWADPEQRADIIQRLAERGIDFDDLANATGQPEADPFDLLCHVAFNAP